MRQGAAVYLTRRSKGTRIDEPRSQTARRSDATGLSVLIKIYIILDPRSICFVYKTRNYKGDVIRRIEILKY